MIPILIHATMVDGDWVLSLVKVILGGLLGSGGVWAVMNRRNKGKQRVTLDEPTKVQTERVYTPPTYWQHRALERRVGQVESDLRDVKKERAEDFLKLMNAGEQRQNRLMDKMDEMKTEINQRIDAKLK